MLWQWLWRSHAVRRAFYEILGLILIRRRNVQMLNCGYSEADYPAIDLAPGSESERFGIQLYHRLVRSAPMTNADVLEIGCGRGGGARFVAGHFQPRSYWATDSSRMLLLGTRFVRRSPGLRFRHARADRLPFEEGSADLVICVESVHLQRHKGNFLNEMARVLRPGGRLLIADFFYSRDSSPNALTAFRRAITASGLIPVAEENWTKQAIEALEQDSPRRLAEIRRLPRGLHKLALAFATTSLSPLYHQLRDGRANYVHFELSAPPARA